MQGEGDLGTTVVAVTGKRRGEGWRSVTTPDGRVLSFKEYASPELALRATIEVREAHLAEFDSAKSRPGLGIARTEVAPIEAAIGLARLAVEGRLLVDASVRAALTAPKGYAYLRHGRATLPRVPGRLDVWELSPTGTQFRPLGVPNLERVELPLLLNETIERPEILARAHRGLRDYPMVTFTGTGGIGKTRQSLELAKDCALESFDSVVQVLFADVVDGQFARHLSRSLTGSDVVDLDACAGKLRERSTLVVLDNLEHLRAEAAEVLWPLIQAAPNARWIATSREALGIAAEVVVRVSPLKTPPELGEVDRSALKYDAARLLTMRAKQRGSDDDAEASVEAVREIACRLAGIPLALELAAGPIALMGYEATARSLAEADVDLTDPHKPEARHRSMGAAVAWSWKLLHDDERSALKVLCQVPGFLGIDEPKELMEGNAGIVQRLADKGLVEPVESYGGNRGWRVLEPTREFVLRKSAASDDRAYVNDWVVRRTEKDGLEWVQDHILAVHRAIGELASENRSDAVSLAFAASPLWTSLGWLREGIQVVGTAAENMCAPLFKAELSNLYGALLWSAGDLEAASQALETAGDLFGEVGNTRGHGKALHNRALVEVSRGKLQVADELFDFAEMSFQKAGSSVDVGVVQSNRANASLRAKRYKAAATLASRAAASLRQAGEERGALVAEITEGEALIKLGDVAEGSRKLASAGSQLLDAQRPVEAIRPLAVLAAGAGPHAVAAFDAAWRLTTALDEPLSAATQNTLEQAADTHALEVPDEVVDEMEAVLTAQSVLRRIADEVR